MIGPREICCAVPAIVLLGKPAQGQECQYITALRSYANQYFQEIIGSEDDGRYTTSYVLPGAECSIDVVSERHVKYTCEWYVVRERTKENEAAAVYNQLVESSRLCVHRPESIESSRYDDERGVFYREETSIDDRAADMGDDYVRRLELSYEYWSHWWIVEMTYVAYQDEQQ